MRKAYPTEPKLKDIEMRVLPGGLVARKVACALLDREYQTLANWMRLGLGPLPRRHNGRVYYRLDDLRAWRDHGAREAING